MKKRAFFIALIGLLGLSLCLGTTVIAADDDTGKSWRFDLAPFYLWGINLSGDLTLGNPSGSTSQNINVPFSDVFSNLEAVFIFHFEGVKDNRWGFLIDYDYLDIGGNQSLPLNNNLDVNFKATLAELAGFYRVAGAPQHHFDILAGIRYMGLEASAAITGPAGLNADGDEDWLDPFLGLRWNWQFAEKWNGILRGDVGGFSIGSDIALQGAALLYWQPFKHVGFIGGYRVLYADYESGSGRDLFVYDVTAHGPIVGLNITW